VTGAAVVLPSNGMERSSGGHHDLLVRVRGDSGRRATRRNALRAGSMLGIADAHGSPDRPSACRLAVYLDQRGHSAAAAGATRLGTTSGSTSHSARAAGRARISQRR
jgi:hypothetical protein